MSQLWLARHNNAPQHKNGGVWARFHEAVIAVYERVNLVVKAVPEACKFAFHCAVIAIYDLLLPLKTFAPSHPSPISTATIRVEKKAGFFFLHFLSSLTCGLYLQYIDLQHVFCRKDDLTLEQNKQINKIGRLTVRNAWFIVVPQHSSRYWTDITWFSQAERHGDFQPFRLSTISSRCKLLVDFPPISPNVGYCGRRSWGPLCCEPKLCWKLGGGKNIGSIALPTARSSVFIVYSFSFFFFVFFFVFFFF